MSVHIENDHLITGGIDQRPKRVLTNLRHLADDHRGTGGFQTRSHRHRRAQSFPVSVFLICNHQRRKLVNVSGDNGLFCETWRQWANRWRCRWNWPADLMNLQRHCRLGASVCSIGVCVWVRNVQVFESFGRKTWSYDWDVNLRKYPWYWFVWCEYLEGNSVMFFFVRNFLWLKCIVNNDMLDSK